MSAVVTGCIPGNGNGNHDTLLPSPSDSEETSEGTIVVGRLGDHWLDTMAHLAVRRGQSGGVYGYAVTYDSPDGGTFTLFWARSQIDLSDSSPGYRGGTLEFDTGRVHYPTRITRESLPDVHRSVVLLERAYGRQAAGAIAAVEMFGVISALAGVTSVPRPPPPTGLGTSSRGAAGAAVTRGMRTSPAASGAAAVTPSSRALARALEAAGQVRPPGAAAHHIVAVKARRAEPARRVLQRLGIGINDAVNGVFLPATRASPNPTGAAIHSTLHTKRYYDVVNIRLRASRTRAEAEKILHSLGQRLLAGGI
ncbi:MAG: AHH domain-containing protein [Myxococcota bacterium]